MFQPDYQRKLQLQTFSLDIEFSYFPLYVDATRDCEGNRLHKTRIALPYRSRTSYFFLSSAGHGQSYE